jgi:carbon-monoxide dehydrogenase medium subunit
MGDKPVLATASRHLLGKPVAETMLADARAALDGELEPHDDQQATSEMRRYLARQLLTACVVSLLGRPDLGARAVA